MGAFSIWHVVILGVVALVIFGGRGKVSDLMGDFGRGITSFKRGMGEPDDKDSRLINTEAAQSEQPVKTSKDPIVL